jgi:hypothetical protein
MCVSVGNQKPFVLLLMWLTLLKVGMCSTREVQVLSALNSTSSSPQQYKRSSSTWGGIRLRRIPPHRSPCCASSMHRGRQQEQQLRQSATTRPSSSSPSSSSLSGAESAEKKTALRGHGRGKACLAFFVPLLLRCLTSLLLDTRLVVCFSPVFMNVLQVRNRL